MVMVDELLKLPATQKFRIVAGKDGLKNAVENIGILEYEELEKLDFFFIRVILC